MHIVYYIPGSDHVKRLQFTIRNTSWCLKEAGENVVILHLSAECFQGGL